MSQPAIRQLTLPNGMKVILAADDRAPAVSFYNWVRVGSADERDDEAGMAHVLEHMLFKGTPSRGVGEIAQEVESCGGDINAFTSFDTTVYYVTVASRYFDRGLAVLFDAVHHSMIDAGELELEKEVILEEIKRGEDSPSSRLSQALFATAFQVHPYRRPVIGYRDIVAGASREAIWSFYKRWYYPANMVLVVAGDFDPKRAAREIRRVCGKGKRRKPRTQRRVREPKQDGTRIRQLVSDAQETYFDLGFHIPNVQHADIPALDVLSVALGAGNLSRLGWRLRRVEQVATSIQAFAYTPRNPGLFLIGGTAPLDRGDAAIRATTHELFGILDEHLREDELERARTSIEGEAVYERETVQGIARKLGFFETVAGDLKLEDRYYKALSTLTIEDVQKVARRYLKPENLTMTTLAPEGAQVPDEKQLRALAQEAHASVQPKRRAKRSRRESVVTLDNGARLVLRADRGVPIASLRGVFLGGLRVETEETNGLSHLVSRLQHKGTQRRGYSEILRLVDGFAGSLSGFAGYNSFGLRCETLSKHLRGAVELFSDVLLNPSFDAKELDVDRGQVLQAILSMGDHLSSYCMRLFTQTLYQKHPYRMSLLGTADRVAEYQPRDLQEFYARLAKPDNFVLAAVGDFDVDHMEAMLSRHLSDWRGESPFELPSVPQEDFATAPREVVEHKRREQAHVVVGFPGVTITHSDRHALELLAATLGGQAGRLFKQLRDKEALAYSVTAFSQEALDPGYFAVYIATDPSKLDRATAGIRRELELVKKNGIRLEELEGNARQIVGQYEIDLQRSAARAASFAFNERYGLGYDYYRRYPDAVLAVTVDDVVDAARRYLDFDRAAWAIIRPEVAAIDAA